MEKTIKCLFLAKLIKTNKNLSLASLEVSLMQGRRKADILTVENNNIIAYEIKSSKDNLSKLDGQIQDYLKICDKVYVILDEKFFSNDNLSKIPLEVGIFCFHSSKKDFFLKRKAKKNIPLSYYQSLFISQDRLKYFRKNSNQSLFDIRHSLIQTMKKREFKQLVIECLNERFLESFMLLKSDYEVNSTIIHPDDIYLLSKKIFMRDN